MNKHPCVPTVLHVRGRRARFSVTTVSQRLTPPKADIRYMIVMAICTSVTSTLWRESNCSECYLQQGIKKDFISKMSTLHYGNFVTRTPFDNSLMSNRQTIKHTEAQRYTFHPSCQWQKIYTQTEGLKCLTAACHLK